MSIRRIDALQNLSRTSRLVCRLGGWYPKRRANTASILEALAGYGISPSEYQKDVLANLTGVRIRTIWRKKRHRLDFWPFRVTTLKFHCLAAIDELQIHFLQEINQTLDKQMIPFGVISRFHDVLLID